MLFDKGKLEKLTLRAYEPHTKAGQAPQPSPLARDTYVVQVNPGSYTLNHLLSYSYRRGQGFSGSEAVYSGSPPVNLSFEFLFDGTGVIPKASELGDIPLVGAVASALSSPKPFVVMDEIKRFDALVYEIHGEIHSPRKLLLVWGTLVFSCVLTSVAYRFTLFAPDGSPLRAIAACTFCEHVPDAMRARKNDMKSPDLTRLREVRDGDTLPMLANEAYGRPELYMEVARVNKLINFRSLRSATRLAFPPVAAQVKR